MPFQIKELASPDAGVAALFRKAFGSEPPSEPRHFVALHDGDVAGYIHFIPLEGGIFLCGGLCVDARVYRRLETHERKAVAARGSLSRWLSDESISALGPKRAVFAYTGNTKSRRDAFALGFRHIGHPHLLVQWHDAAPQDRATIVHRVDAMGAF